MEPQVIHLIMCDRAYEDPRNFLRINVQGLQVRLIARRPPPIRHDLCALVMLFGYRGRADLWFRITEEASGARVSESRRHPVRFPPDPEELFGFRAWMNHCPLPRYGRYRLELWLDDRAIASKPFWLLPRR
jgi:hypothetical protein